MTADQDLDNQYLPWLYRQATGRSLSDLEKSRSYWRLFRQMYSTEFVWFIANDDNRAEDGRALRYEFLQERQPGDTPEVREWFSLGCSFLEMLVGVARRLAFEAGDDPRMWFWQLLETLDLTQYNDASRYRRGHIGETIDRVIWRTYEPDGRGGLFPLDYAQEDQTEVEIWYQLSAWLLQKM